MSSRIDDDEEMPGKTEEVEASKGGSCVKTKETSCSSSQSQGKFKVAHCQEMGRFLVAAKDLAKGEIIFQELPITSGPERDSALICPGCYEAPDEEAKCTDCGWPICGYECSGKSRHEIECKFLSENHQGQTRDWRLLSDCLMIIRCLLLKRYDPTKWQSLLDMETNWEHWSRSPLFRRAEETLRVLRGEFGMTEENFTTDEILDVQAVLDINAYEVRMPYVNIQASYAMARLAEHNCVPNTHKTISSLTLELTLRAAKDIPEGTHLTTSYCDILWPTAQRQQYLQWSKFFICNCRRCQDPTELGSFLSALICPRCPHTSALLSPNLNTIDKLQQGLTRDFDYICTQCNHNFPSEFIEHFISTAEEQLQLLDKEEAAEDKAAEYEKWLNMWTLQPAVATTQGASSNTAAANQHENSQQQQQLTNTEADDNNKKLPKKLFLHPQHSLVLDACHTLFLLYSREDTTPEQELQRKIQLGQHLLTATKPFISGISKFHGTIMYEMALTKVASFVRLLEAGESIDERSKFMAHESLKCLRDSLELLKYEPADQPEGILAQTGRRQLEQLGSFLEKLIPELASLQHEGHESNSNEPSSNNEVTRE